MSGPKCDPPDKDPTIIERIEQLEATTARMKNVYAANFANIAARLDNLETAIGLERPPEQVTEDQF